MELKTHELGKRDTTGYRSMMPDKLVIDLNKVEPQKRSDHTEPKNPYDEFWSNLIKRSDVNVRK